MFEINRRTVSLAILLVVAVAGGAGFLITTATDTPNDARHKAPLGNRPDAAGRAHRDRVGRGDNGVWMRRHWIHGPDRLDDAELAARLDRLGMGRIYPFVGPMNENGEFGWRKDGHIQVYPQELARGFFHRMQRLAPQVKILPWTGGLLDEDIQPEVPAQREAFAAAAARLVELGADGVHVNIEPLPTSSPGYLELLRQVKAAIGSDKTLSIAAYPPTTPLHPFPKVHWTLDYTARVCQAADALVVMAYDTSLRDADVYKKLVADWTQKLVTAVEPPAKGGCQLLIGLPAYEDDTGYRRPDVETLANAIRGVNQGLSRLKRLPEHFRGVAVYSSWTTDADEWSMYERLWRDSDVNGTVLPDYNL